MIDPSSLQKVSHLPFFRPFRYDSEIISPLLKVCFIVPLAFVSNKEWPRESPQYLTLYSLFEKSVWLSAKARDL